LEYYFSVDDGNVFGWGNSEYGQFEMVTNEPQVNLPIHLPLNADTGHVKAVASAGTKCAVLNGMRYIMQIKIIEELSFHEQNLSVLDNSS